jgi:hemerythrin
MGMSHLPTWSADYETGIKAIDNDHKALFEEIRHLAVALLEQESDEDIERAITCLENYVNEHFNREEIFMINAGYPGTVDHIKSHKSLRRKVTLLRKLHHDETATIDPVKLIEFLSNWLSNHILKTDMVYVPYLHGEKEDREENLEEKLHEVTIQVPDNKKKTVEDFLQIISSDHPLASELTDLIEQFEMRLEEHDLAHMRATFCSD